MSELGGEAHGFSAVCRVLNEREPEYLRARRLRDGPKRTAMVVAGEAREALTELLGEDTDDFLRHADTVRGDLKLCALNAIGWFALKRGAFDSARAFASEVVARDHHDLLAQRLIDAAEARSVSLDLEVDRWLKGRTCMAPFKQIETRVDGNVHFCCSAWQPAPIGSINDRDDPFWNSERAAEIRRSVTEGDFQHCSRWHCPSIAGRRLTKEPPPPTIPQGPDRVILSHDRSCNISCPSCRTDLINLNHARSGALNTLYDETLQPLISDASWVKVTGSGDPFASRHFRYVLKSLTEGAPRKRIQLHTNALLANQRAWDELRLWGNVTSVWVSIDAGTAESYSILRRGGNFRRLKENLKFLGELRASGELDVFRLDVVVQKQNFRELGTIMDLREEVGADAVYFLRLRNWGHFSAEEFRQMDVCSAEHPEHDALLDALADPKLTPPVAELGSMSDLVRKARARAEAAEVQPA